MGRKGSGVELRGESIRLSLVYQGLPRRETLRLGAASIATTAAKLKYAHRVAAEIRWRIAQGLFDDASYAEYFPDSQVALAREEAARKAQVSTHLEVQASTFGALAKLWLASKGKLEAATRDQYATAVRFWTSMFGADTPVVALTHGVVAARLGAHAWKSAKNHNNYLIALRGIFALEYRGRQALDSPMVGIENMPVVKKLPDPLSGAERDTILADMARHYDPRVVAYFQFMFFTGMRPEEAIALRWSDIDLRCGTARVQRVRTFRGSERDGSKTHAERDVDLVSSAIDALSAMRPYTSLKRDADGREADVFENPVTGCAWHDERSQRENYWHPCLKRLGIRQRRSYCTRHTYCTVALMGGVNPAYIAAQAGHSPKMLLEVYTRWIPGADGGAEKRRLVMAMGANSSQILPIRPLQGLAGDREKAGKSLRDNDLPALDVGRRDWTRTNDPHHVKVVL
ncbi:MAG: phage integrase family protein [Proteobacteria bacterium]|nr:phage integrase family protein [Pseudomonadota bacterium]